MLAGKLELLTAVVRDPLAGVGVEPDAKLGAGGNCIKIGLPGKSILRDYYQENMTSRRPFLFLRISFPGRPVFIEFIPGATSTSRDPSR